MRQKGSALAGFLKPSNSPGGRVRAGEWAGDSRRLPGTPRQVVADLLDHHRIFDARDHLNRTATVNA